LRGRGEGEEGRGKKRRRRERKDMHPIAKPKVGARRLTV